jgi:hypothetical protein
MCASQIPHFDQCAADRAIAEMLDFGPLGALAVGASVSWDLRHRLELIGDAGERWCFPVLLKRRQLFQKLAATRSYEPLLPRT